MSHFCLLKDPENYRAEDWDLVEDEAGRNYWLGHFEKHFEDCLKHALNEYGRTSEKNIAAAARDFEKAIAALREDPTSRPSGKLSVIELDYMRDDILREHGLPDPYFKVKQRANLRAIEEYPQVVRELHAMADDEKWLHLVECVFAGNLLDFGSVKTMHMVDDDREFLDLVEDTKPRPWKIDDYDALADALAEFPPRWGKAVVFVDNAGADFVLGIMPLVRELALRGTGIVIAANEAPALNDMTADEAAEVVEELAVHDPDLSALIQAGMFEVVSTGSRIPLLDLCDVSDELNTASEDADAVILEGMGRAVETNYAAEFKVDAVKLALLKSDEVARRIGAEAMDCVCRFQPAGD